MVWLLSSGRASCGVLQHDVGMPEPSWDKKQCFFCRLSWGTPNREDVTGFGTHPDQLKLVVCVLTHCLLRGGCAETFAKLVNLYSFYSNCFSKTVFQVQLHTCYSKSLNVLITSASFTSLSSYRAPGWLW